MYIAIIAENTNNNIVKVNKDGTVIGISEGSCMVYSYINNSIFECQVTVVEPSLSQAIITNNYKHLSNKNAEIAKVASKVIKSEVMDEMSEIEKVKAIHDYIVLNAAYDYTNYKNNTIPDSSYTAEGILINHIAVCQGYATTFQLFMETLNIPCYIVRGKSNGQGHTWNIVEIDDKWYQIDATWDDPVEDKPGEVQYNYFMITDEIMSENHTWDKTKYPACTSKEYLYYPYRDYMIESISEYEEKFSEQFYEGKKKIIVLYPENKYPDWNIIWKYSNKWNYYNLKKRGNYYMMIIDISD